MCFLSAKGHYAWFLSLFFCSFIIFQIYSKRLLVLCPGLLLLDVSLAGVGGSRDGEGRPPPTWRRAGPRLPEIRGAPILASLGSPVSVQKRRLFPDPGLSPALPCAWRSPVCSPAGSGPQAASEIPFRCRAFPAASPPSFFLLLPLLRLLSLHRPPQRLPRPCRPSPQLRATLRSLRPSLCSPLSWLTRDPCELPVQGTDLRPQCLGFCGLRWC